MDGSTNPSIAKHLCRPSPDGLGLTFWKKKIFFLPSLFLAPPSLSLGPSLIVTVLLVERSLIPHPNLRLMMTISSARSGI